VSLQHLPVDKRIEKGLPAELLGRLAFASQKLDEVRFWNPPRMNFSTRKVDRAVTRPPAATCTNAS